MKKQVIFLLVLGLATTTFAFEKGTKTLGGALSFSSSTYFSDTAITQLRLAPDLGYFVIDDLLIEASPLFSLRAQKDYPTEIGFGLGVGGRYFFGKFYLGAMFNFNFSSTSSFDSNSRDMDLKAGCLLPLAKNIYLDLAAKYNFGIGKAKFGDEKYDNDFHIFSLSLGVAAFFK